MLIDLLEIEDGTIVDADICIVGSGAAGLSMAQALRGTGLKVVVLEAGGRQYDDDDQALYDGELAGIPYFPLDSARLRYYGGTTNHWAGYCLPYRRNAFERRSWLPHSGWPLRNSDIDKYVTAAARLIGLPEVGWDTEYWSERLDLHKLSLRPQAFSDFTFLIQPKRFAIDVGPVIESDPVSTIYLHANLVEIETDELARTVTGMVVRTRQDGRRMEVRASRYVLAAGGIENARLLLHSDRVQPGGLGNRFDLVGRYFADHVSFYAGLLQPSDPGLDLGFYSRHSLDESGSMWTHLELPFEVEEAERLVRTSLRFRPRFDPAWSSGGLRSLRAIWRAVRTAEMPDELGRHLGMIAGDLDELLGLGWRTLRHGQVPLGEIDLTCGIVPAPNPESRVTLIDERDELGMRRVKLDWRLSPIDKRSARFMIERFAAEAGAAGIGRVKVFANDDNEDFDDMPIEPAYHHMCTTRMADDPREGVVDSDCRVHGIDNLYCAGSSVFSTAGEGTPTLMIVALALRLADHLKELKA